MSEKIKILYVDDEVINTQLFEINFSRKYDIYTALNGTLGLTILKENPTISLIISDMNMPGLNGLEFIQRAKKNFPLKRYFILTGFEITPEIEASLQNGLISNYFQKPFNIKEIESEIEKYASFG